MQRQKVFNLVFACVPLTALSIKRRACEVFINLLFTNKLSSTCNLVTHELQCSVIYLFPLLILPTIWWLIDNENFLIREHVKVSL